MRLPSPVSSVRFGPSGAAQSCQRYGASIDVFDVAIKDNSTVAANEMLRFSTLIAA